MTKYTSKCNVKDFIIINKNEYINIKNIYNAKNTNKNVNVNNNHINICFLLNNIDDLFIYYIKILEYCLKYLIIKHYITMKQQKHKSINVKKLNL